MSNLLRRGILGSRGVTGHPLSNPALAKEVKITKFFLGWLIPRNSRLFLQKSFSLTVHVVGVHVVRLCEMKSSSYYGQWRPWAASKCPNMSTCGHFRCPGVSWPAPAASPAACGSPTEPGSCLPALCGPSDTPQAP